MSDSVSKSIRDNIWVKIAVIILVSLLMLIPVGHIQSLIEERHQYGEKATLEVSEKWSKAQWVGAVSLGVPLVQIIKESNSKGQIIETEYRTQAHFLPNQLKVEAHIQGSTRNRGIFKVPVYESKIILTGNFKDLTIQALGVENSRLLWAKAKLSVGINELKGLKDAQITWNGKKLRHDVGKMPSGLLNSSINGSFSQGQTIPTKGQGNFSIELTLKGSQSLEFLPLARSTQIELNSDWGSPSFGGSTLPDHYESLGEGFLAQWSLSNPYRKIPNQWAGKLNLREQLEENRFGVNFRLPMQNYQLNTRAVKYAILIILLTFITVFFVETLSGLCFHPIHYAMIGAGLTLFYLLLLSISEITGFAWAYGIASLGITFTLSLYVLGITHGKQGALTLFGQLSLLYGFIFVILREEEFALVFGASGLWVILAGLMFATRKIDWFKLGPNNKSKHPSSEIRVK